MTTNMAQLILFPAFLLTTSEDMIDHLSYTHLHLLVFFTFNGYITNSQSDQLLVGLIVQLVEHCTGIAEVMGWNPVQAGILFQTSFSAGSHMAHGINNKVKYLFANTKHFTWDVGCASSPINIANPFLVGV